MKIQDLKVGDYFVFKSDSEVGKRIDMFGSYIVETIIYDNIVMNSLATFPLILDINQVTHIDENMYFKGVTYKAIHTTDYSTHVHIPLKCDTDVYIPSDTQVKEYLDFIKVNELETTIC